MSSTDATPLTEEGTPSRKTFKDADSCFTYADRLAQWDTKHLAPSRGKIKAFCKEGALPWLKERKVDQTNFNWSEGRDLLNQRLLPYINRLKDAENPLNITPKELDPQLREDQEIKISMGASYTYKKWKASYTETLKAVTDMVDFGLGVVFWPTSNDPRFERVERKNVFFEAESKLDVESLPSVVIRATWKAGDLLALYEMDDAQLEQGGYKRQGIKQALQHLYNASVTGKDEGSMTPSYEDYAKRVKEDDFGEWSVQPLTVYQVAFRSLKTTKVDVYVVAQVGKVRKPGDAQEGGQSAIYLRQKHDAYEKMGSFVGLLPLDGSASTLASLRGHGHQIYPKALLDSRLKCLAIDNHEFENTRWFTGGTAGDSMRTQIVRKGPYGMLPPQVMPVEMPKRDAQVDFLQMIALVEGELKRGVTGNFFQQGDPEGRKSAMREQIDLINDSSLTAAEIGTFDFFFDQILEEFYRRLSGPLAPKAPGHDLRKEFRDQMEFYQVEDAIWKFENIADVFGERVVGGGSVAEQLNRANNLVALGGSLGARGSHHAVESLVRVLVGNRNVRKFIAAYDRLADPTVHNWDANQESISMLAGQNVLPPYGNQRDEVHINQHLADFRPALERILSQEVQGLEGIAPFVGALAMLMPHLDVHLARLEEDPVRRRVFDQLKPQVEELRRIFQQLEKIVRDEMEARANEAAKAQAEQPQEGQMPPETVKALAELERSQLEFQQKMEQKSENFQRTQEEKRLAFELGEARKDLQTMRDAQRDAYKDAAKAQATTATAGATQ